MRKTVELHVKDAPLPNYYSGKVLEPQQIIEVYCHYTRTTKLFSAFDQPHRGSSGQPRVMLKSEEVRFEPGRSASLADALLIELLGLQIGYK